MRPVGPTSPTRNRTAPHVPRRGTHSRVDANAVFHEALDAGENAHITCGMEKQHCSHLLVNPVSYMRTGCITATCGATERTFVLSRSSSSSPSKQFWRPRASNSLLKALLTDRGNREADLGGGGGSLTVTLRSTPSASTTELPTGFGIALPAFLFPYTSTSVLNSTTRPGVMNCRMRPGSKAPGQCLVDDALHTQLNAQLQRCRRRQI